jgi:protein-arginine kinase activator protein McsA
MKKSCSRCKKRKDTSEFNKRSGSADGFDYKCRDCAKEAYRVHYYSDEHIDTIRAKSRVWRQENPDTVKNGRFKRLYGITLEQYLKMKDKQNGCCATCGKEPETLCVDHDHTTGKVRGLLCSNCNRALGFLQDNIDILRQAVKYLRKHKK